MFKTWWEKTKVKFQNSINKRRVKLVKKVAKWLIEELEIYEAKNPDIQALRYNIYNFTIPELMNYFTTKLSSKDLKKYTIMSYFKELNDPLTDSIEGIIDAAIDGLAPKGK